MSKRPQEKRRVPRISLSLPVDLKRLDALETASTDDFTPEGVFIATREQLEPGTRIELAFKFPPVDPNLKVAEILLEGEVVWSGEKFSERQRNRVRGIGVRFVNMNAERLEQVITLYERLNTDTKMS